MHHEITPTETVSRWNRSIESKLIISSGDTVTAEMRDASDGQVTPRTTDEEFADIDSSRVHGLTGPIDIHGAEPGDVLKISIENYEHHGWGWTGIIPGSGLLQEEFDSHFIQIWELSNNETGSLPGVTVPVEPFCGIIGVQRQEHGSYRTHAPGEFGGNIDVRHLTAGSELFLPVQTPKAGLCVGDGHAAQGDGEVSVTGIEAPLTVRFTVTLHEDMSINAPRINVPNGLESRQISTSAHQAFVGSAKTARAASKMVTKRAIAYITEQTSMSDKRAYILCSAVLRLKISQLVNEPMVTVTGYLPESIFD